MFLETLGTTIVISGSILIGYATWEMVKDKFKPDGQTKEDRSCSYLILGKPGSGKTGKALLMFYEDVNINNLGALWVSTQGIENSRVLDFIKPERVKDTILIRPYSDRPLGINILRRYTKSSLERELIADNVVTLFKRLFEDVKDNMQAIIYSATIALLTYSDKENEKVSLLDLYNFLNDQEYRSSILEKIDMPVILDTFKEIDDDRQQSSLKALLRRFRKALSSEHLLIFLSQKDDDVDLLECVKKQKIIVCDLLAGGVGGKGLGLENSAFLAELIVSKFQLIAESRNLKSPLYPLYLDEFQTYTSTADNVQRMVELNRQRRMPVILICQRLSQLTKELQEAVDNVGTKYIFKTNHKDNDLMSKKYPEYKNKFEFFPKRVYLKDELIHGNSYIGMDRTPDFPKLYGCASEIIRNCRGKKTRNELLKVLYKPSSKEDHIFE